MVKTRAKVQVKGLVLAVALSLFVVGAGLYASTGCPILAAQAAWAASGDGSSSGSVNVIQDEDAQDEGAGQDGQSGAEGSAEAAGSDGADGAATGNSGISKLTPQVNSGLNQTSGSQAADGADADGATPLDSPNNRVNEGQLSDSSFLDDANIADLAGADSYYDNQTVQITGEAVGEALSDGGVGSDHVWVLLQDLSTGDVVSVWMDRESAEAIDHFGKYGVTGSTLRVRGEFHLSCSEHDGESDVHATTVTVVEEGYETPDAFDFGAFIPGLAIMLLAAMSAALFAAVRERSR